MMLVMHCSGRIEPEATRESTATHLCQLNDFFACGFCVCFSAAELPGQELACVSTASSSAKKSAACNQTCGSVPTASACRWDWKTLHAADRVENIRRVANVAKLMADSGLIVLASFISPFRSERDMARGLMPDGEFIEIHVDTPLEVAEERDVKGLYKKARAGELKNFTGIDSEYQAPETPEIRVNTVGSSPEDAADQIFQWLVDQGYLPGSQG